MLSILSGIEPQFRRSSQQQLIVEMLLVRFALLDRSVTLEEVLNTLGGGGGGQSSEGLASRARAARPDPRPPIRSSAERTVAQPPVRDTPAEPVRVPPTPPLRVTPAASQQAVEQADWKSELTKTAG